MLKDSYCKGFITSVGTSVPENKISWEDTVSFLKRNMILDERLKRWIEPLVRQTTIKQRYSVLADFGGNPEGCRVFNDDSSNGTFPTTGTRMSLYRRHALPLAAEAAINCMNNSKKSYQDVTHLIVVSCTGMYAPGIDIDLVNCLGLSNSVSRTCIGFMGCYAAFNALKLASAVVTADSSSVVLVVCVELCTLHFQFTGKNHLVSNMLFGDGAAAALITADKPDYRLSLGIKNFATQIFPEGNSDMTWEIADFGFVMNLTQKVPEILSGSIGELLQKLESGIATGLANQTHYVFHPGGPRILDEIQKALGLTPENCRLAREVLQDFGNMSSSTIFFVLERLMNSQILGGDKVVAAAFGPGLTCESALFEVQQTG